MSSSRTSILSRGTLVAGALVAGALTAGALTTVLSGTVAPAEAAHPVDRAAPGIALTGRGWGHGHGMSQYGAEGAAEQGLDSAQILAFYYPGLQTATAGGRVSVLISADRGNDVVVSDRPGLTVQSLGNHRTYALRTKHVEQWRITPDASGSRSAVSYKTAGWHLLRTVPGEAQFSAGGAPIALHVRGAGTVLYRGLLRSAAPSPSSRRRDTVNVLPLDGYLKGVVPNESPASWRPAALEAQAVAARTYAAFERREPLARDYQICDTSACQVYDGFASEQPTTSQAVQATKHQILTWGGQPAFTQFSASNGGWTAAGSQPYLVAEKDPYDKAYRNWHATVTAAAVEKAFPAIGSFRSAEVLDRDGHGTWNGRVVTIRLTGSTTSTTISGDTFRSIFGLRSTWFVLG